MKKILVVLFGLLFSDLALAAGPCLYYGALTKCLPSSGLLLTQPQSLVMAEAVGNGTNAISLTAPASLAADYSVVLPSAQGASGTALLNDGSGTLSWGTPAFASYQQQAWVSLNGDDGTGTVGQADKPFATLAAAEAAISDAADDKRYVITIGPGDFDVTGMEKKSFIFWQGAGQLATTISTIGSTDFDLANADMATIITTQGFSNLHFTCPLLGDFLPLAGIGKSIYQFFNVLTTNPVVFRGRGGDRDSLLATASDFDDGWELHSMNAQTNTLRFAGAVSLHCDSSNGGQWLGVANLILAAVIVQDDDNATFCLIGMTGSIVGGSGFTIDGANAQAYLDASTVISNSITQSNGGTLNPLTQYNRINTSGATGALMFASSTVMASDSTNLFWDDTSDFLGIGTNAPAEKLDIAGGNLQLPTTSSTEGQFKQSGTAVFHTFGSNNLFVGGSSGNFTLSGAGNAGVGRESLLDLTSGNNNVAFGYEAGKAITTADENVAIGRRALMTATTGAQNTAVGTQALQVLTTGSLNTMVGYNAGVATTNGGANAVVGYLAFQSNTSGGANVAMGYSALSANTTANYNVAIGSQAGDTNTTGEENVIIGRLADVGSNNLSNAIAIGANAVVNTSNSMVLGSGVNVGIGSSSPGETLDVVGTVKVTDSGGNGGNVPHERIRRNDTDTTSDTCAVSCSAGETLTGGGCDNTLALNLARSFPSADDTWYCEYTLATGDCTAWAVCFDY